MPTGPVVTDDTGLRTEFPDRNCAMLCSKVTAATVMRTGRAKRRPRSETLCIKSFGLHVPEREASSTPGEKGVYAS